MAEDLKEGETKPLSNATKTRGIADSSSSNHLNDDDNERSPAQLHLRYFLPLSSRFWEENSYFGEFIDAVYDAAHGMAPIAIACCCRHTVRLINLSGFGIRMSSV